jgi:hypothetical protein
MENAMSSIAGSMFMIESPCRTSKKNQSYLPRACRVPAACLPRACRVPAACLPRACRVLHTH